MRDRPFLSEMTERVFCCTKNRNGSRKSDDSEKIKGV